MKTLGLYVHIPFCLNKCIYCDFYSLPKARWEPDRYTEALAKELRRMGRKCEDYTVDTIYIGGGTPTCLGAERLALVLDVVKESFAVDPSGEVTFEANPESIGTVEELQLLRETGFNRVSLGVQSADDGLLRKIGRPHTFQGVREAVERIRRAGFTNLSMDLIYGLPDQSMAMWQDTLRRVTALEPEHLSCYGLQVEEGTPLWKMRDRLTIPDEDAQAEMYLYTVSYLEKRGFAQYEISNFAREGRYSRHNMKYWRLSPYLGIGPGASSDFEGCRFDCPRDIHKFCENVENGGEVYSGRERISPVERGAEYLMLGLRTGYGISREGLAQTTEVGDFDKAADVLRRYAENGYAVCEDGRWHLTPKGFLVSNRIILDVLEQAVTGL